MSENLYEFVKICRLQLASYKLQVTSNKLQVTRTRNNIHVISYKLQVAS